MIQDIFMPALSSTMTEGKIVSWTKSPGDKVEKGETVVVVESDKADMDVESFHEGYLATILVEAGHTAPVGAPIALIAETEAEIQQAKQQPVSSEQSTQPATTTASALAPAPAPTPAVAVETPVLTTTTAQNGNGRIMVSPRARKLAKQLKVDLKTLQGSGSHGRIVGADVEQAAGKVPTPTPVAVQIATAPAIAPTPKASPRGTTVPLNTLQQAVVRNMVASLQVPTYHVAYTIITDALDKLYKQIKSKGVTMTALLAKAVAITLTNHPLLNSSYTESGIVNLGAINIAVAVAMPGGGLITPVLQHADQLDIYSLSRQWKDLVARARTKQLQPEEYNSGTFTISNLGMFGVDSFDAILPPGTGSILAIGASNPQPIASAEGLIGIQRQMKVNITCDHRVIYGAEAAAFLRDLAKLIQTEPHSLTL